MPAARVERLWPGETVVCIASGPSLTDQDVAYCRGKANVIVVNDNYLKAPWADALYACDLKWWAFHKGVPSFTGLKYSIDANWTKQEIANDGQRWGVQVLKAGHETDLSLDPERLARGDNSGYQALNLAVLLGAKRIVLLGYDMQLGPQGEEHWFGSHPYGVRKNLRLEKWPDYFASLVQPLELLGVEVVNASRRTRLTAFPRVSLESAL